MILHSRKFSKGLIFEIFEKYLFKIKSYHYHACTCTSGMFHSGPRKMALLKYFKCIEPSKEERIQSVLLKSDGPLARLKPSSAIEDVNSAVREIFTYGMIGEDSPTPCNEAIFKTVCGTCQTFTDKENTEFAKEWLKME